MKKVIVIISIFTLVIFLGMGVFKLLINTVFNSKTCHQYNIDNIELRTGINIPSVIDVECKCEEGYKNSIFVLNTEEIDIQNYLVSNNFKKDESGFFSALGESRHSIWYACFNEENSELSVELNYLD